MSLSLPNRATVTVPRGEKQTQTSGCMVSKNFTLTSLNLKRLAQERAGEAAKTQKTTCPINVMTTRPRGDVMRTVGRF